MLPIHILINATYLYHEEMRINFSLIVKMSLWAIQRWILIMYSIYCFDSNILRKKCANARKVIDEVYSGVFTTIPCLHRHNNAFYDRPKVLFGREFSFFFMRWYFECV
jgi:hypothetical protein